MKAKLPLIIVIVVVIVLIAVAIILGGTDQQPNKEKDNNKITGVDAEIASEIYGFSAEIKNIKDKTLTLEAWVPMANENADPTKGTVKAVATENTRITKITFPKEVPTDLEEPVYPEETELSFEELKVGDKIDIGAVNNISENIKNGTEFELSHIFIIE